MNLIKSLFSKHKAVVSTPFAEFIRNASSAEKKKVYTVVLKKATEQQQAVVETNSRSPAQAV